MSALPPKADIPERRRTHAVQQTTDLRLTPFPCKRLRDRLPDQREGPKMRDSDLLESRRRIEQRIDVVLGNLDNPTPNATGR